MNTPILIAVIAGFCGMLGWGFGDFFAKKTIDIIGDMATLAWAHVAGVCLLIVLCAVKFSSSSASFSASLPHHISDWIVLLLLGALQAVVYLFVYRAFAVGKVSLLNPIFSTYSGLVVLLSVVVFGEAILLRQWLLVAAVFVGVVIMSLERDSAALKKFSFVKIKGSRDIVIATILASVWTLFWARFVANKDWLVYATLMYSAMLVTILVICSIQQLSLKVTDRSIWKFLALIGVGEVVAYVGVSRGYSLTSHTSIVAVLSAAFSVPTLVLSKLFLKESISRLQLIGVVSIIVAGALLAALS